MNYIKKTFKDKKVIKALIVLLAGMALALLGFFLFEAKWLKFGFLFVGTMVVFLQFPVISNTAMRYYEEEEAEKRNKKHPKKK